MSNLMPSFNIEDKTEGLRYDKVILATDADVDGLNIRNSMIAYCFKFFERRFNCRRRLMARMWVWARNDFFIKPSATD